MLSAEMLVAEINALMNTFPDLADDEEMRADVLEGETEIDEVLTRIIGHIQAAELNDELTAKLAQKYTARRKQFQRRSDFFRALVLRIMTMADLRKKVLPAGTISVRNLIKKAIINDEEKLPDAYIKITKTPDRAKITNALNDGDEVDGASLSNGGETISLRI